MKDLNKGFHTSPNIHKNSELYEIENRACDPGHKIENFIEETFDLENKNILDIGCGTAYHLPYFSSKAHHLYGVEPFDNNRLKGMKRVVDGQYQNISLLKGTAESIPLESGIIDFAYSRFAYFWGKGCEKGLEEVSRILTSNGSFLMIDNNLDEGTFGSWVKRSFGHSDSKQKEINDFWSDQGFQLKVIHSEWRFESREDLENVLAIEFPQNIYKEIINEHKGNSIDYVFNLYFKKYERL